MRNKRSLTPEKREQLKQIVAAKDTDALKTFILDRQETNFPKKEVEEDIKILNESPVVEKKPKQPTIRVKKAKETIPEKSGSIIKATPEQIHILVHTVTKGVSTLINKEEVSKEEAKPFSDVLYEIGEDLKWWDTIEFLPYLILIFSGIDLSLAIMKKPSKVKSSNKIIEQITEKIERVPDDKPNVQFDIVDEGLLMEKLGGNNIYGQK